MTGLTPLMVIDTHDREWDQITADHAYHQRLIDWARGQGLNPVHTYRVEIYLVDCPFARVFQYATDENGTRHCGVDHDHRGWADECRIAELKPSAVILSELPPEQP